MTALDPSEDRFISERKTRERFGLFVFPAAIVFVCLVWAALFSFVPMLVNPFEVISKLETQTLAPGTLTMFVVVGALAMNVVFLLMVALSVLGIVIARRERRYLKMIDRLRTTPAK